MATTRKIELSEVKDLLEKIKDGSTGNTMPLSEILRLCLRLAKQLGNEQLSMWALAELNGYQSNKELPDYRILDTPVLGHFSGPYGSGLRNAQIPQLSIEEKHRDSLFSSHLHNPIAELEQLSSGDESQSLQAYWSADIVAYYQRKQIYQGMVLATAWRAISKSTLKGVLDTVRTRVLEFALSIQEDLGIKGSENKKEVEVNPPTDQKVTQNVHNIIYGGNVSVGNLGDTTQNNIVVQPGDWEGLKKTLKGIGITDELVGELDKALQKDEKSDEQPGPATQSWISRVMIMIGRGSLSVASNAAGSLVATAIMQYLRLTPPGQMG